MKTGKILLTALASLALSTAAYAADGNGTEKRNVYLADWTPQNPKAGEAIYINLTQPNLYGQEGVHTTNQFLRILTEEGMMFPQNFTKDNDYLLGYNSLSNIGGEDYDSWKDYDLDRKYHASFYKVVQTIDFKPGTNPELDYENFYVLCKQVESLIYDWKPGTLPSLDPKYGYVKDTWYTYDLKEKR